MISNCSYTETKLFAYQGHLAAERFPVLPGIHKSEEEEEEEEEEE